MPQTAQHLLGQLVDGRFPLRRLLGTTQNSAVFLTDLPNERPSEPAPEAAIKLIPEDPDTAEQQLERWKTAAALSHPGLLRILHFGRSAVDGSACLFIVMELASENLSDLLPQRALTAEEASGMMAPVLATLDFLHENGLVHGGVKPSNILAKRDAIKLSPDRILPAGESATTWPLAAPYAPPESVRFPASDVWSLGISLYETLTQYLPKADSNGHYVLPQLPSPFAEVIRGALVQDPTERITLDDVCAALDPSYVPKPKPVAVPATTPEALIDAVTAPAAPKPETVAAHAPMAVAAQASAAGSATSRIPQPAPLPSVDPLSVPLSPVSPSAERPPKPPSHIPVSSLPNVNVTIAAPRRVPSPRTSGGAMKYFIIGAVGTLVLAALILPRMLRNAPAPSTSSSRATTTKSSSNNAPQPGTTAPVIPDKTAVAPSKPATTKPAASESAPAKNTTAVTTSPVPAAKTPATSRSVPPPVNPEAVEVVHQVVPDVSAKARSTIRGTVRINVRVQVNPDGSVSAAELDSAASSPFFANIALKAARDWRFAPSGASSALLRFDFTNSGSKAYVVP